MRNTLKGDWECRMWSCFWECFFFFLFFEIVCYCWGHSCVHFSCKRGIFSSQACRTLLTPPSPRTHTCTHTNREARRLRRNLKGSDQSCCVFVLFFFSPLTISILAPGVISWTVSNSATAFQITVSVKWKKKQRMDWHCMKSDLAERENQVAHWLMSWWTWSVWGS